MNRDKVMTFLKKSLRFLPDKSYIKLYYRLRVGRKLNMDNPTTLNEKLQWMKFNYRFPLQSIVSDKLLVRDYVKEKIGEEYLIPLLGSWKDYEDIDFSLLPKQFVLKCNHDSGGLVVCTDKDKLDFTKAKDKVEKSLKSNFFYIGREYQYRNIKPKGACVLCVLFVLGVNYNKIVSLKKEQKKVFGVIFGAILILMAIYLYNNILINIKTYAYRMRGFQNLLDYMLDDSKRLMFGISDIAYADNGNTYVNNIRSFLGWEASVEMAHVNILIKNGLLGVFPYIMIYKSYISEKKYLNSVDKSILLALIILMLISGFVETYIVSIHYVVGPVLYCLVNGIISQKDKQEIKENEN